MGHSKSAGNSSSELTVETLLRGVLTLEQDQAKKVFVSLQKGMENLVRSSEINSSLAREFRKIKTEVIKEKKEKKMKTNEKMIELVENPFYNNTQKGQIKEFLMRGYLMNGVENFLSLVIQGIEIHPWRMEDVLFKWKGGYSTPREVESNFDNHMAPPLFEMVRLSIKERKIIRNAFLSKIGEDVEIIYISQKLEIGLCPPEKVQEVVDKHCVSSGVEEVYGIKMSPDAEEMFKDLKEKAMEIVVIQEWLPHPTFSVESGNKKDVPKTKAGTSVKVLKSGEECDVYDGWTDTHGTPRSKKSRLKNEGGNAVLHSLE